MQESGEVNIVVAEPWQNRGIGSRTVAAVAAMAKRQGYTKLFARVYSFNRQSQRMFEKVGFVRMDGELYCLNLE